MKVFIKKLPTLEVAYIRRTGSYFEPQDHWGKLLNWSIENKLYPPEQSFIGISLDNPEQVISAGMMHVLRFLKTSIKKSIMMCNLKD
ncbi:hypothetical protein HMPREF1014_02733 [Bacillus sp. 7_6_55CFAA_CT2]|nr:hypothetical protein DA68_09640 [Bacillus cereus]EHL72827.1 hypothetical protein HMPREF1014_02733 [Bacillus sp. 7_6_55CFAA_CT2]